MASVFSILRKCRAISLGFAGLVFLSGSAFAKSTFDDLNGCLSDPRACFRVLRVNTPRAAKSLAPSASPFGNVGAYYAALRGKMKRADLLAALEGHVSDDVKEKILELYDEKADLSADGEVANSEEFGRRILEILDGSSADSSKKTAMIDHLLERGVVSGSQLEDAALSRPVTEDGMPGSPSSSLQRMIASRADAPPEERRQSSGENGDIVDASGNSAKLKTSAAKSQVNEDGTVPSSGGVSNPSLFITSPPGLSPVQTASTAPKGKAESVKSASPAKDSEEEEKQSSSKKLKATGSGVHSDGRTSAELKEDATKPTSETSSPAPSPAPPPVVSAEERPAPSPSPASPAPKAATVVTPPAIAATKTAPVVKPQSSTFFSEQIRLESDAADVVKGFVNSPAVQKRDPKLHADVMDAIESGMSPQQIREMIESRDGAFLRNQAAIDAFTEAGAEASEQQKAAAMRALAENKYGGGPLKTENLEAELNKISETHEVKERNQLSLDKLLKNPSNLPAECASFYRLKDEVLDFDRMKLVRGGVSALSAVNLNFGAAMPYLNASAKLSACPMLISTWEKEHPEDKSNALLYKCLVAYRQLHFTAQYLRGHLTDPKFPEKLQKVGARQEADRIRSLSYILNQDPGKDPKILLCDTFNLEHGNSFSRNIATCDRNSRQLKVLKDGEYIVADAAQRQTYLDHLFKGFAAFNGSAETTTFDDRVKAFFSNLQRFGSSRPEDAQQGYNLEHASNSGRSDDEARVLYDITYGSCSSVVTDACKDRKLLTPEPCSIGSSIATSLNNVADQVGKAAQAVTCTANRQELIKKKFEAFLLAQFCEGSNPRKQPGLH
jgi:hypothetical protein